MQMCVCVDVFMCAYACGWIVGELWLGRCVSKGPMLIEIGAHCFSSTLSLTHTLIHCPPTVVSELPLEALPGPSFTICKVGTHIRARTHTHSAFISASPVTVSLCLGREIGLCRAQRLESPKAAPSNSAPAVCDDSLCQPSLKSFQTSFSQSHQPTLD